MLRGGAAGNATLQGEPWLAASLVMATWKYFVNDKQATALLSAVMTGYIVSK